MNHWHLASGGDFANDVELSSHPASGRYIVTLRGDIPDVASRASDLVAAHGGRLGYVYRRALTGFSAELPRAAVDVLRLLPDVVRVSEVRWQYFLHATQTPTPNWGLDRIDQRDGLLNNSYFYERTGAGVHLYTIDSGIRLDHQELAGRLAPGWDFITPGGNGNDECNGHGTHVSTIAAGSTFGVAKQMIVHPVKVFPCSGPTSNEVILAGIDAVTTNRILPAVANLSFGGAPSVEIDNAVNNMIANGIITIVSAGNFGINACDMSPARVPNAITVAASDNQNRRAIFNAFESSNFGSCVDLFAPGKDIRAGDYRGATYDSVRSGTSMAAPHVAGTAALWLEGFPASSQATVASTITTYATANVLHDVQGSPNKLLWMRFANQTPTADFVEFCNAGGYCTFYGYPSVDDVEIVEYFWTFQFGSPTQEYGETVMHDFGGSGSSTVTLRVKDAQGRQHEVSKWLSY